MSTMIEDRLEEDPEFDRLVATGGTAHHSSDE